MTTITIDRELLEQALVALSAPNHCVFSEPPICVDIRAALAAPATAPDRHAQELLAMEITLQNMRERHAQEICAYELTVQNLRDQIASAPAWHDAPTVPGLWITTDGQSRPAHWLVCRVTDAEHEASQSAKDERWYGPIPEDKT